MDLDLLKYLLADELGPELAALWQRYADQGLPERAESFLAWLFQQKLISFASLERILSQSPVELGSMPQAAGEDRGHRMLGQLGQGAMGVVHLARDQSLLRKVAYKQLLGTATQPMIRRFLNEVRITAQLEHPAIVPVYQLSLAPGPETALPQVSYSMKLVQGDTLKQRLQRVREALEREGRPGPGDSQPELLEVFLKVCDAMSYAHARQVIHRDLKPANLMIGPYGDVYVMDWGIARRFRDSDGELAPGEALRPDPSQDETWVDQTQSGQILGTPRYMSPQQAAGRNAELDGRSDLFALGLILYEILALKPAFRQTQQIELLKAVLKAELAPLEAPHPAWQVHPALKAIVARSTGRKPEQRYAGVEAMAADLRRYLRGERVSAYAEPWHQRGLRLLRRHGRATLLASLGLTLSCLLIITGSLLWQMRSTALNRAREADISRFLSLTSGQAQAFDQHLLAQLGRLAHLAATARQALQQGQPGAKAYRFDAEFSSAPPADYSPAPAYGRALSLDWPGVKLAPGLSPAAASPELAKLYPLRSGLQRLFALAAGRADWRQSLRSQGLPLVWAYVGLAGGAHFNYPGKGGYAPDYDPRQRPWYTQALDRRQPFWGEPYGDASGQGLLLPALAPLRDDSGKLLGVAGLDYDLRRLAREPGFAPRLSAVSEVALLDRSGKLRLRLTTGTGAVETFATPADYPLPALSEALRKAPDGVLNLGEHGQLAYYRLGALGWTYVVSAPDLGGIAKPASQASPRPGQS